MEMMPLTATAESRGPYIIFVAACARIETKVRKRKTRGSDNATFKVVRFCNLAT